MTKMVLKRGGRPNAVIDVGDDVLSLDAPIK